MNDRFEAFLHFCAVIFLIFFFAILVSLMRFPIDKQVAKQEAMAELVKEGIRLGVFEYKIVDKLSGKTEVGLVIPKTDEERENTSKWLQYPIYTIATQGRMIVTLEDKQALPVYIATFQAEAVK